MKKPVIDNTLSPIDLALKALSRLYMYSLDIKAYTDEYHSELEELAKNLAISNLEHIPVLIRMDTQESKKRKPYADLIEKVLKDMRHGISISINSVAIELIGLSNVSLSSRKNLLDSSRLTLFKVGDYEVDANQQGTTNNLLNWAKLESLCVDYSNNIFSQMAGGSGAFVYVFDDYKNFLNDPKEKEIYQITRELSEKVKSYYKRSSSSKAQTLEGALQGFCHCLNRLAVTFNIKVPSIGFLGNNNSCYELVAAILDLKKLDRERNKIAAFVIDLEWLPSPEWIENHPEGSSSAKHHDEEMGDVAIRLLNQRYPEIPCFVLTGMWSIEILQKSLAVGAKWCFQKPISHHLNTSSHPSEELSYFTLEQHLTEFSEQAYGVYSQIPDPTQLNLRSTLARQIIEEKMPGESREEKEETLRKLIARSFTAETIDIIHILGSGKSSASATFFVRSTIERTEGATRFIKLATWLEIYKEYTAYQQIIRPKLNNHTARIIQPPAVITDKSALLAEAINISSLAGFPEDYTRIKSLQDILTTSISKKGGDQKILPYLLETIDCVLLPLQLPVIKKEYRLTEIAIPVYTGRLKPILEIQPDDRCPLDGDRKFDPLHTRSEADRSNLYLQNWKLISIHAKSPSSSEVEIIIEHPYSKARCQLRGESHDCQRRFGALWLKLGMLVALDVKIDSPDESYDILSTKVQKQCSPVATEQYPSLTSLITLWKNTFIKNCNIEDPFEIFKNGDAVINLLPLGQSSFGNIHGDLNLNNLIYPSEHEKVGFLIDFSEAELEGLSAFDCAWLETQIWTHYLLPSLVELSSYIQTEKSTLEILCDLLYHALEAMNCNAHPDGYFKAQALQCCQNAPEQLLQTIANTLIVTQKVRHHFTKKIFVPFKGTDIYYALFISFLQHAGYQIEPPHPAQASHWINVLSYLCSAYYLQEPYKQASTITKKEQMV